MLTWNKLIDNLYLVKEDSDRVNRLNSLIIQGNEEYSSVLIDANYPFAEIDALYSKIKKAKMLIFSHGHLDHTAHAFYHQEKYGTTAYCPVQEREYLTDLDALMELVGFNKLGLTQDYRKMIKYYIKFKECEKVTTFDPGNISFKTENFIIKTIHIPGHSPGHTAFELSSTKKKTQRKILYVSDIGSHPYYGDLNSNISQYRDSIDKLEHIYLNGDYILVPAHGNYYIKKDRTFFERIRNKININKEKVLNSLNSHKAKSLRKLVDERIITPPERVYEPIRELYYLWDGGMINQHLIELINEQKVKKIKKADFLSHKYIKI
ncbi:MAG: hypothetical protein BAJALOKI1v1_730003 [Promethearchaeota archaeon]|nr:MAG: hypothetical protein BAJALOKI1v1_730003 [Candidatus Lokiarchaeota archaeon]